MSELSERSNSRERCIEDGGHFWPSCDDGTKPPTCTRCGYNPSWVHDPNGDQQSEQSVCSAGRCEWCGCTFRRPSDVMYHRCAAMQEAEQSNIRVAASPPPAIERPDGGGDTVRPHTREDLRK